MSWIIEFALLVSNLARHIFLILLVTLAWLVGYLYDCITYVLGIGEY